MVIAFGEHPSGVSNELDCSVPAGFRHVAIYKSHGSTAPRVCFFLSDLLNLIITIACFSFASVTLPTLTNVIQTPVIPFPLMCLRISAL